MTMEKFMLTFGLKMEVINYQSGGDAANALMKGEVDLQLNNATTLTAGAQNGTIRLLAVAGGQRCVVWHSHLSEGERLDGWLALATGEARVVVGARSAVFAPVRNLRLVVVDEEHAFPRRRRRGGPGRYRPRPCPPPAAWPASPAGSGARTAWPRSRRRRHRGRAPCRPPRRAPSA